MLSRLSIADIFTLFRSTDSDFAYQAITRARRSLALVERSSSASTEVENAVSIRSIKNLDMFKVCSSRKADAILT